VLPFPLTAKDPLFSAVRKMVKVIFPPLIILNWTLTFSGLPFVYALGQTSLLV